MMAAFVLSNKLHKASMLLIVEMLLRIIVVNIILNRFMIRFHHDKNIGILLLGKIGL